MAFRQRQRLLQGHSRGFSRGPSTLSAGLILLLLVAAPLAAHGGGRRSTLADPEGGGARGEFRLDEDEIRLEAEGLAALTDHVISSMAADGALIEIGRSTSDDDGRLELRLRGEEALPDGLNSALDLAGRPVEVREVESGALVLEGTAPARSDQEEFGRGRSPLVVPADAPFPDATGRVTTRSERGRQSIEVRVAGLDPHSLYSIHARLDETTREMIGAVTTKSDGGGKLKIDTSRGDGLPFGAGSIEEIAGVGIEVEDEAGTLLLVGSIPAPGAVAPEGEIELEFDLKSIGDEPEIRGDLRLESEPEHDKIRVRIRDAIANATYEVRVAASAEKVADGELIDTLVTDEDGEARSEWRGRPIFPLGANSLEDLEGAAIQISRIDEDAVVPVLGGTVPEVPDLPDPLPPVERLRFDVPLSALEAGPRPGAHGKVEFEEQDDEREIEIEVEDLMPSSPYIVEIVDLKGIAGVLFDGDSDSLGDIRDRMLHLGSDMLPLGVSSFREYDGFSIRVMNEAGDLVLEGEVVVPDAASDGAGGGLSIEFTTVGAWDGLFLRGDSNSDSGVDIADAIHSLSFLFGGGQLPLCLDAADSNDDGAIDVSDPIHTLIYLFSGGERPPFPGATIAGHDSTVDSLYCVDP